MTENPYAVIDDECILVRNFLEPSCADRFFQAILEKAHWKSHSIRLFNQNQLVPRLTAWYGDNNAIYTYSGVRNEPLPEFEELSEIRAQVEQYADCRFNSVLLNLYRNGNDSMGAHSDNERELGENPVIASISLGEQRRIHFHPKPKNNHKRISIDLPHGSLLLMFGSCQINWKHSVPKTRRSISSRINLTYRLVRSSLQDTTGCNS